MPAAPCECRTKNDFLRETLEKIPGVWYNIVKSLCSELPRTAEIFCECLKKIMKKNSVKSVLILFSAAFIWGFAFVWQVRCTMPSMWFTSLRFLIGGVVLLPAAIIFERKKFTDKSLKKKLILWGAAAGVALCAASSLQQFGISLSKSSGKAGFITGTYMVMVPIADAVIAKAKLKAQNIIGAVVALGGLFLISFSGGMESFNIGDVVVFLCAIGWVVQILIVDRTPGNVPPVSFSIVQYFTCALVSAVIALIANGCGWMNGEIMLENLESLLFCGILSSGVAFTAQVIGQRGCEPGLASIIMCTESVFAGIGGALLLNENLGLPGYIGCALVFAGILIAQIKDKEQNERTAN